MYDDCCKRWSSGGGGSAVPRERRGRSDDDQYPLRFKLINTSVSISMSLLSVRIASPRRGEAEC